MNDIYITIDETGDWAEDAPTASAYTWGSAEPIVVLPDAERPVEFDDEYRDAA